MISLSILGNFVEGNVVLDTDDFPPGPHNLTIRAFDQFGNIDSSTFTFFPPGMLIYQLVLFILWKYCSMVMIGGYNVLTGECSA